MTEIYYTFIVLPIIIFGVMAFIFQSSLDSIAVQQLKMNCPYPINAGIGLVQSIDSNNNVNYTVTWDNSTSDYHQTVFRCGEGDTVNVYTTVYTTANNWFNIGTGYLFYLSNVFTALVDKIVAFGNLLYQYITAPAQVTGLAWFNYINVILIAFIIIGLFMVVRG